MHRDPPLAALSGRAIIELATSNVSVWACSSPLLETTRGLNDLDFKLCSRFPPGGGGTLPAGFTNATAYVPPTATRKVERALLIAWACVEWVRVCDVRIGENFPIFRVLVPITPPGLCWGQHSSTPPPSPPRRQNTIDGFAHTGVGPSNDRSRRGPCTANLWLRKCLCWASTSANSRSCTNSCCS